MTIFLNGNLANTESLTYRIEGTTQKTGVEEHESAPTTPVRVNYEQKNCRLQSFWLVGWLVGWLVVQERGHGGSHKLSI